MKNKTEFDKQFNTMKMVSRRLELETGLMAGSAYGRGAGLKKVGWYLIVWSNDSNVAHPNTFEGYPVERRSVATKQS